MILDKSNSWSCPVCERNFRDFPLLWFFFSQCFAFPDAEDRVKGETQQNTSHCNFKPLINRQLSRFCFATSIPYQLSYIRFFFLVSNVPYQIRKQRLHSFVRGHSVALKVPTLLSRWWFVVSSCASISKWDVTISSYVCDYKSRSHRYVYFLRLCSFSQFENHSLC